MLRKIIAFFGGKDSGPSHEPAYPPEVLQAFALCQGGRVNEAEEICRNVIAAHPDNAWAFDALGLVLIEKKLPRAAEDAFREALSRDSAPKEFYVHLTIALQDQGRTAAVVEISRAFVSRHPKLPEAHFNLGTALATRFESAESLAAIRQGIKLDAQTASGYVILGKACLELGETNAAIEAFQVALGKDPSVMATVGTHLSEILASMGRTDEAAAILEPAIQSVGTTLKDISILGMYLERRGLRHEALKVFLEATKRFPTHPLTWASAGRLLATTGDFVEAEKYLKRAVALGPSHNMSRALFANFRTSQKRHLPLIAKQAATAPAPCRGPSENIVVIRGGMDASYVDLVKHHRAAYPDTFLILSTWVDTDRNLLNAVSPYVDEVVLCERPATSGINNINYQVVCAARGVERAVELGAQRVLVTRTDIALLQNDLLEKMAAELEVYDNRAALRQGLKGRLLISDLYTLGTPPYHVSDMFIYGYAGDVRKFWNLASQTDSCCRPEVTLCRAFAARIGRALYNTPEDTRAFYRDFFIIKDASWFEFFWVKNPCYLTSAYADSFPFVTEDIWRSDVAALNHASTS